MSIECRFVNTIYNEYACLIDDLEALDSSANYVITGQHLENRANSDIEVVRILNSNTPFMIQQIFTTFSNMVELEIGFSNLQSINIPDTVQLNWLDLYGNNITRIGSGNFQGQTALRFFYAVNNNIQEIAEDAFEGLSELITIQLINNRITEIAPRTFQPVPNVNYIDFERNNLTSIGEEVFSWNQNLASLYLEFNEINEIHPRFAANLRDSLRFINLTGNRCIGQSFFLASEAGWRSLNAGLQTCFNNFNGTIPEARSITMEFTGNLSIFDEFGNLIVRV